MGESMSQGEIDQMLAAADASETPEQPAGGQDGDDASGEAGAVQAAATGEEEPVDAQAPEPPLEIVNTIPPETPASPAPQSASQPHREMIGTTAGSSSPIVQPIQFGHLPGQQEMAEQIRPIDLLLDVRLQLTAELGRKELTVKDALSLGPGSVVELDRVAGEPVDLFVNGKLIARGEVVVIDENFGVRVTEVVSPAERLGKVA